MAVAIESSPTLSDEQCEVARAITESWARGRDHWTIGHAGTGKSTLAQYLARTMPECLVCAPTGKACEVWTRRGIAAKTLHSWLYAFKGLDDHDQPIFASKRTSRPQRLIVDECSMLTESLYREIRSKRIPTLYIGDPGQLPPVNSPMVGRMASPDSELTTIHRQAEGSPIIQLAHKVRCGADILTPIDGIEVESVTDSDEIAARILGGIDRGIVRTNRLRVFINRSVRMLLGRTETLEPGDEVICLANEYSKGLVNGQLFTVQRVLDENKDTVTAQLLPECGRRRVVVTMLKSQFNCERKQQEVPGVSLFDFAWAITGHKAQGSQWRHVGVLVFGAAEDVNRWNYTAVTRAQEKLTLFRYAKAGGPK